MYMSNEYNFYNLEASFSSFLTAGNKTISLVSVKNYRSDLRHFLGWLILKLQSEEIPTESFNSDLTIIQVITVSRIQQYKAYMLENNLPINTVNRRLSTVRKFCSFGISQGWITENPAKSVQNEISSLKSEEQILQDDLLLEQYKKDEAIDDSAHIEAKKELQIIRNYLSL